MGESYDRDKVIPLIEAGDVSAKMLKLLVRIKDELKMKYLKCGIGPVDKADMLVSSFLYSRKRFFRRVKTGRVIFV